MPQKPFAYLPQDERPLTPEIVRGMLTRLDSDELEPADRRAFALSRNVRALCEDWLKNNEVAR